MYTAKSNEDDASAANVRRRRLLEASWMMEIQRQLWPLLLVVGLADWQVPGINPNGGLIVLTHCHFSVYSTYPT